MINALEKGMANIKNKFTMSEVKEKFNIDIAYSNPNYFEMELTIQKNGKQFTLFKSEIREIDMPLITRILKLHQYDINQKMV